MDYLTKIGSEVLKNKILDYWKVKGYTIEVWKEYNPSPTKDKGGTYFIRSNLINGLPIDYKHAV